MAAQGRTRCGARSTCPEALPTAALTQPAQPRLSGSPRRYRGSARCRGAVGGVDQAVGDDACVERWLGLAAFGDGVDEGPVGFDVGADGETDLVVRQRQVAHPV